ncbi:MAG: bi-domain-containing oxidoreductase [Lentisphaerae bacterium]|nr:bi-domain-containing oxidoreductase [Lentisphaerota bacterium]
MKQIFRRVIDGKGKVLVKDVPVPAFGSKEILVANKFSLISSGTESSTVRKTPSELVKQTLQDPWMRNAVKKMVLGGSFDSTVNIISQELTMLRVLGYSSAGVVVNKGSEVAGVEIGDHVACAGANYANHAEVIRVPQNLFVTVDKTVPLSEAAFIRVAAIGMHGLRRAKLEFGESVGIIGLGLLGQLTAQIALSAGMDVYGMDVVPSRLDLVSKAGVKHVVNVAEDNLVDRILMMTDGLGLDSVIICAASKDKSIANNAMKMCRKQGRVVAVGIVRMDLERMPFFVNELDFRFSRGHGPGARDDNYEIKGMDYPYGYVRWTEKRNMEEVARLMAEGRLSVTPLIGEVFSIDEAPVAYEKILSGQMQSVASLIEYKDTEIKAQQRSISLAPAVPKTSEEVRLGLIGCGNFVRTVHLPNLAKIKAYRIQNAASATGITASSLATKYGIGSVSTDYREVLSDKNVDAVVVAMRHNQHAAIACEAAEAGKHVFMEKPMALTLHEYAAVAAAIEKNKVAFMVGYNRRYAPLVAKVKKQLAPGPVIVDYQVNVGRIPTNHWTLDPVEGGGRLLGESDHFFDLFCYLAAAKPVRVYGQCIMAEGETVKTQYNFTVVTTFDNSSICTLTYTGLGNTLAPKETVRIFSGGRIFTITDYKELVIVDKKQVRTKTRADKGHFDEWHEFLSLVRGEKQTELPLAPLCALYAVESLNSGKAVDIQMPAI